MFVLVFAILIIAIIHKCRNSANLICDFDKINVATLNGDISNMKELNKLNIPLLIIYFHPECEFCSFEISELIECKHDLNEIQLVFITFSSIELVKKYIDEYSIDKFEHVIIASDINGEFANAFNIKSPPMNFIYNKNKKLVRVHKGMMSFKQLKKYLNQLH